MHINNKNKGFVRIGTSGVVLPGPKENLPEEFHSKSRLYYYSRVFNTLEINSTFYKLPRPTTLKKWYDEVPANFGFTVKLWKQITHNRKLLYSLEDLDQFIEAAKYLGNKVRCLLIQFPGKITFEYLTPVEEIIQRVAETKQDADFQIAVEFRNSSWYNQTTYNVLQNYKASVVFHDIAASKTPDDNSATHLIYLRFHGPDGDYRGSYSDSFLQRHADRIKEWVEEGKDVYVYFNNTMGAAFHNAQYLQNILKTWE